MIVVFGSVNVDLVLPVAALPRPGETVLTSTYDVVAGGKGANQALAAARAGAPVAMYGCVGRDGFAETALALLRAGGVDLSGVRDVEGATGCAMVCVDRRGENQIVVASGANLEASAGQVPDGMLVPGNTVLLQLEVATGENRALIARARDRGARIVLNAAPASRLPDQVLAALDVLVVNQIEAAMLAEQMGLAEQPAQALARRFGLAVVVTLGGSGARAFTPGGDWSVGALAVEPVDTTGAGDAFTGTLAAAMDGGAPLPGALRLASVAAGLSCTLEGAQPSLADAAAVARRLDDLAPAVRLN